MELDRIDLKILNKLRQNAKISNQDLAEAVGLSTTPCARRVKLLEDRGVIKRYVALIDAEAMQIDLMVFVSIEMDRHTQDRFTEFEQKVSQMPEVVGCHMVTGQSADFLLKVLVKDMKHYEQILLGEITKIKGVKGVHSSFALRNVLGSVEVPLE